MRTTRCQIDNAARASAAARCATAAGRTHTSWSRTSDCQQMRSLSPLSTAAATRLCARPKRLGRKSREHSRLAQGLFCCCCWRASGGTGKTELAFSLFSSGESISFTNVDSSIHPINHAAHIHTITPAKASLYHNEHCHLVLSLSRETDVRPRGNDASPIPVLITTATSSYFDRIIRRFSFRDVFQSI